MYDYQPNRPADGWEEGRAPGPLPKPATGRPGQGTAERVPAVDIRGSLDRPVDAGDPVDPFEPAVLKR